MTRHEFERQIEEGGLIEHASYCGNYYGTPREYVRRQLEKGKDVILEIEIQGALKIKEKFPTALLLFVMPPNAAELKKRLEGRGTETPEVIEKRLERASEEAEGIENYDYIVINDRLEECVEEMHGLILAAHRTPERNGELIREMRKELEAFNEGSEQRGRAGRGSCGEQQIFHSDGDVKEGETDHCGGRSSGECEGDKAFIHSRGGAESGRNQDID